MSEQITPSQAAGQAAVHRLAGALGTSHSGNTLDRVTPQPPITAPLSSNLEREHAQKDPDFWAPESETAVVFQVRTKSK